MKKFNSSDCNIWFTSDTHFGHKKILELYGGESRFGLNIEEHDKILIENWNKQVRKNDLVFHLGDFCFAKDIYTIKELVKRLNGRKFLILGNHDYFIRDKKPLRDLFEDVYEYLSIKIDNIPVILFHYPIHEWNLKHSGSFHLHGHTHGKYIDISGKIFHVGIDGRNDMCLWNWNEIKEILTYQ